MRASSVLIALLIAGSAGAPASAQSLPLYLQASGVPTADMTTTAPTAGALGNYDPARNADPGLTIRKGGSGPDETDPAKMQTWLAPVGAIGLNGRLRLLFWSAVKNFSYGKRGYVTAYLQDCNSAGAGCSSIAYGSMMDGFWSDGGSGWVEGSINFGAVGYNLGAGRRLALKLIVSGNSEDDMWFAYASSAYPSRLELLPDPGPGQCTTSPPTQYAAYGARSLAFEGRPKVNGIDAAPYPCSGCNALRSTAVLGSAAPALPTVDSFQSSSSTATQTLTGTIAPGDYGTLKADGATFSGGVYRINTLYVKGTPVFNAGTYYIDRLLGEKDNNIDALGDQQIKFSVAGGPVRIIIGTVLGTRDSGSEMNRGGNAADLHILLAPGAAIMARDHVKMSGFIYAPYSTNTISVANGLELTGAILTAGTLSTGTGAKFTFGAAEQAALAVLRPCTVPASFTVEQSGGGPIGTQMIGQPFNVRITARDALDNVLAGYDGSVDLSSTGALSAGGGTTAAFVNGVLATHAVTISNTGTFTLAAVQTGGAVAGSSNSFAVIAPSSRFNAFEPATPAGSLAGVIKTKIGGQPFTLDLIAINSAGTGLFTSAVSPVTVELLDAADNSGALNAGSGCRSSWTPIATITSSFSFAAADNGRKSLAMTLAGVAREVRVRITSTASGGLAGCSTDAFAVRPASFVSLQATDSTDLAIGTTRLLANSNATGGVVHRAGRAFSVAASAVLADGAPATGYGSTPQLTVTACVQPAGCTAGGLSSSLVGSSGAISGAAVYDEAGVISVVLGDSGFAAIDAADSSAAERTISSAAATFGRFVADSYRLSGAAPQFAAPLCAAGPARQSFTYVGQPFSFGTAPVVLATPLNAAGAALANARPRFAAANVAHLVSAAVAPVALSGATGVSAIAHGASSSISFAAGSFAFARGTTPVASFVPTLTMTVDLADTTENATAGNGTINALAPLALAPIGFAAGADGFHYGRVQLRSSYGDVRRELYMPLEVQRYNGLGWVALPDAGACLSAAATSFAYGNATALLTSGGGLPNCASRVAGTVTTGSGRAAIRLDKPGDVTSAVPSAMTATLNLLATAAGTSCSGSTSVAATTANTPWLANPDGTNPSARLTWGRLRGELIGLRERFD